jgi:nitrite reductase (NADH) large subunit
VVIGGGLLGLECAKALRDMGLETHVVEFAPRLMAVQVDDSGGRCCAPRSKSWACTCTPEEHGGDHRRRGPQAPHGLRRRHPPRNRHDRVLGRHPPARRTGARRGWPSASAAASPSTARCRTSDPDIYAIGECALWNGQMFGLVAPGYEMARVAARHIAGEADAAFTGADMSTKLKLMGVDVASIGDAHGGKTPAAQRSTSVPTSASRSTRRSSSPSDGKQLLGAVLVGDAAEYGTLLQMALNGIDAAGGPRVPDPAASDGKAKPGLGVDALPDSAQICSCNNVTKGAICAAVAKAPRASAR